MKSIRVEPQEGGRRFVISIECACGLHPVQNRLYELGAARDVAQHCNCGKMYRVDPRTSFNISCE